MSKSDLGDFKADLSDLFKILLNNSILVDQTFNETKITQFAIDAVNLLSEGSNSQYLIYFKPYLEKFLNILGLNSTESFSDLNTELVLKLDLDKASFYNLITNFLNQIDLDADKPPSLDSNEKRFKFFLQILFKHKSHLFEADLSLFEELNALSQRHIQSVELFTKCLRFILIFGSKIDLEQDDLVKNELVKYLQEAVNYQPILFKLQLKMARKLSKSFKNMISSLDLEPKSFVAQNDQTGLAHIPEGPIDKLVEAYTHTLSERDVKILAKMSKLDPSLNCLIFKLSNKNQSMTDILNKQAKMSDFISLKLNEATLTYSMRNFPLSRKIDQLNVAYKSSETWSSSKIYDPVYLLPNIYNLLDYCSFNFLYLRIILDLFFNFKIYV